jgi:hypothetical protein
MKKIFTLIILSLCFGSINAQDDDKELSLGLHYPLSVGDNFVKNAFNGVIGVDIAYTVVPVSVIDIRAAFTMDYFNYDFIQDFSGHALVFKPKVIGEFNFHERLRPFVSLGYGFMTTSVKTGPTFNIDGTTSSNRLKNNFNGLNFALGLKYNITKRIFVQSSFDYFSVSPDDGVPETSYNKNAHSIYIGAGINF